MIQFEKFNILIDSKKKVQMKVFNEGWKFDLRNSSEILYIFFYHMYKFIKRLQNEYS